MAGSLSKQSKEGSKDAGPSIFHQLYKALDMVQIQLKDVHIRYHDSVSLRRQPFSAGLSVRSILLSHEKTISIEGLSLYLNSGVQVHGSTRHNVNLGTCSQCGK